LAAPGPEEPEMTLRMPSRGVALPGVHPPGPWSAPLSTGSRNPPREATQAPQRPIWAPEGGPYSCLASPLGSPGVRGPWGGAHPTLKLRTGSPFARPEACLFEARGSPASLVCDASGWCGPPCALSLALTGPVRGHTGPRGGVVGAKRQPAEPQTKICSVESFRAFCLRSKNVYVERGETVDQYFCRCSAVRRREQRRAQC